MDTSLIIILSGFLLVYGIKVSMYTIDTLYNISRDTEDRMREEADKNNIPESVKHLYS